MRIDKRSLNASPFVGVFGILSDKIMLIPVNVSQKEEKGLSDLTGTEVFKASIASSPLLGVLGLAVNDRIALSGIALESEASALRELGLKVLLLEGVTALGNLACFTEKAGIVSPVLSGEQASQLESFFGVKAVGARVAGTDLVGASVVATRKGFVVHPQATAPEFTALKKTLGIEGKLTTANYGDRFVGNSLLANSCSVVAGLNTTGHELIRIEEAFYG